MKKLILFLVIYLISFQVTFATDACNKIILQKAEFVWEVIKWVNVRSYPCIYKSRVLRWAKIWEQFKIIAKVDGYYKIRLINWKIVWIWDKSIKKIWELAKEDKWQEIKKIIKPYKLNYNDYIIINKINKKIEKIINNRWYKYKNVFINKLQKLLVKKVKSKKFIVIVNQIIKNIKKVNLNENALNLYKKFHIDIEKVKDYWLKLHNNERKKIWLAPISYDKRLNNSAYEWAIISKDKWNLNHRRNYFDSTYDYKKIENWFRERWVKCKIKARTTSSESIWKFSYRCFDSNCTDELYKSTKEIFDLYMAEKWTSYTPHYRAIVHKYITKLWLWFSISGPDNEWFYNYYMITHYCTEFED